MSKNQPVNFEVVEIKPADNPSFYQISIKFFNSDKVYEYYRKCGVDSNGRNVVIIYVCKITFNFVESLNSFFVHSITREYDVAGYKRQSTIKQSHPNRRKQKAKEEQEVQETSQETSQDDEDSWWEDTFGDNETTEEEQDVKEEQEVEEELKLPKKVRHEKYPIIKSCLENDIPIYLAGPAGSGKNYTVEQIARENGWNFYYTNSVQQEYKLTGFIDAGGTYQETEFYKACTDTEECIFFLDEMDASIPEALVLINAAIANGYFEFPNTKCRKYERYVCRM